MLVNIKKAIFEIIKIIILYKVSRSVYINNAIKIKSIDLPNFDNLYNNGHLILYSNQVQNNTYTFDLNFNNSENIEYINSFIWLRDLKQIKTLEAKIKAHELMQSWIKINIIDKHKNFDSKVWNQDLVSNRIINILLCYEFLDINNSQIKDILYLLISKHLMFLSSVYKYYSLNKAESFLVLKAMIFISISIEDKDSIINDYKNKIDNTISYIIKQDGGHISRNPEKTLEIFQDLLEIYTILSTNKKLKLDYIRSVIDQITVFLRSIRHKDGTLAIFNSGGESDPYKINHLLSMSNLTTNLHFKLKDSGYVALRSEDITAIVDVGTNIKNNSALSFEISAFSSKIISNLNDSDSTDNLYKNPRLNNSALMIVVDNKIIDMSTSKDIKIEKRTEDLWEIIHIHYNDLEYKYGISYYKTLYLSRGKNFYILGEDTITFSNKSEAKIQKAFLRFNLHPVITYLELYKESKKFIFKLKDDEYIFSSPNNKIQLMKNNPKSKDYKEKSYGFDIDFMLNNKKSTIEWSITKLK